MGAPLPVGLTPFCGQIKVMRFAKHIGLWMVVIFVFSARGADRETSFPTLTVLNFQNRNTGDGHDWLQKAFPDMLLTHFHRAGKFQVLEREKMQKLLEELKLQKKGLADSNAASAFAGLARVERVVYSHYGVTEPATAAKAGKLLGANLAVLGGYALVNGRLQINVRVVDVATATVVAAERVEDIPSQLTQMSDQLGALLLDKGGTKGN